VPDDPIILSALREAIAILASDRAWRESPGGLTPLEAASLCSDLWRNPMLGTIVAYITLEPPDGVLPADGSSYLRADYPYLYELLDPEFIDDESHFHTPDLSGLFLLGASSSYPAFVEGGEAEVTLTVDELPAHAHTTVPHLHAEGIAVPSLAGVTPPVEVPSAIPGLGESAPAGVTVNETGGSEPHNNMPPYLAVKYGIVAR
jgi:microcystin-dependent protein